MALFFECRINKNALLQTVLAILPLAMDVTPHTAKSSKTVSMFLKKEKICYKIVYYTFYLG